MAPYSIFLSGALLRCYSGNVPRQIVLNVSLELGHRR